MTLASAGYRDDRFLVDAHLDVHVPLCCCCCCCSTERRHAAATLSTNVSLAAVRLKSVSTRLLPRIGALVLRMDTWHWRQLLEAAPGAETTRQGFPTTDSGVQLENFPGSEVDPIQKIDKWWLKKGSYLVDIYRCDESVVTTNDVSGGAPMKDERLKSPRDTFLVFNPSRLSTTPFLLQVPTSLSSLFFFFFSSFLVSS